MVHGDRPNTISFHRLVGCTQRPMVVRNARLVLSDQGADLTQTAHRLEGVEGFTVSVTDRGSILITADGQRFECRSLFSYPRAGFNVLGPHTDDSRWRPVVTPRGRDRWTVYCRDPLYRLQRTVRVDAGRVRIEDRLTNTGAEPIGVVHRHEMGLGEEPVPKAFLGGAVDPTRREADARGNPTVFVPLGEFGLGLVIEDDVTRNHGRCLFEPREPMAGFADDRLAIPAGESHTIRWSIYPTLHGDYWRFINRVRADWGVNDITVEGPWGFIQPEKFAAPDLDIAKLREYLDRGGQYGVLTGGGWHYREQEPPKFIGFGAGVFNEPFDGYRQSLSRCIENFRAADPDLKFLVYEHCFYNSPQTPEQKQQLRDSWVTGPGGEQLVREWGGPYMPSPMVYPTTTNSFGAAFTGVVDRLMDEFGADGIYQDEANHGAESYTHNLWDRRSAIIDPQTFEITALVGHVTLLSSPYRRALHRHIVDRGGHHVANGAPNVMAENQQPFPRFVEANNYALRAAETHLYTPIVWDFGRYDAARLRRNLAWGTVPIRLNISAEAGPVAHFYPLTTVEVHRGWILARERIIVSESGEYCWPGVSVRARLHCWDAELTDLPARELTVDGPTRVDVPPGGLAVIERQVP